jgi:hypothetical protein
MAITKIIFDKNWKPVIRGQSVLRWNLMGEHDLKKVDKADVKFDKFINLLQVKYGYTRKQACEQINKFWTEHEAKSRIMKNVARLAQGR